MTETTRTLTVESADGVADNVAVNAVAPFEPVATEGAATLDLAKKDTEDISLTLECVKYLCTGDPQTVTGIIVQTEPFLRSLGRRCARS